ncbi:hypothetical protein CKN86_09585 [Carnobacterium divergens]|uniref:minor capsid protein n=1 Tax=Carnobacterium divergens TaxID=2748 RepID=UPI000D4C26D3|nr:minor capsid protein [Carnobacterium divergens]MCO6019339.1 minor capsid protein [Carnobacterium divergens]TFI60677.1 hypothetical protein CKN62_09725 [Carnobacterium divergens]TFI87700.1 hypothetical protein CKN84_09615 [Carnobacterium divergens]TFJ02267.1 hypothetical protein CKN86_09585 [Carnobacterium divergens]TFJ03778.1 hypothetical protein CKN65_09625 [Carnobacterium divergens]
MSINVRFNGDYHKKKLKYAAKRAIEPVTLQVAKDANRYVAKDTGALESSVWGASNFPLGRIVWAAEYAAAIYFGSQSLKHDKNPLASHLWFEVAKKNDLEKWLKVTKNAIRANL